MKKAIYALSVFFLLASGLSAQNSFFEVVSPRGLPAPVEVVKNIKNITIVRLNEPAMRAYLLNAPMEFQSNGMPLPLQIPLPNGTIETFGIVESPILSREVAAQNPEIKTYTGNGLSNKKAIIRLSLTSEGFNAIILNADGDAVYFEKYSKQGNDLYFTYFARDVIVPAGETKSKSCGIGDLHGEKYAPKPVAPNPSPEMMPVTTVALKTFRLAMAANGEFTAEHGGTQAGALATIVGYVNRMTALYRRDLGVSFTLVSGTNLIYTNSATDPYTNSNQVMMLDENLANCNTVIGIGNYDVGHVWGYTGGSGGGIAAFEAVCDDSRKGSGVSGEGDLSSYAQVFMDQLLFHEVGHQFGMSHSYNSSIPVCTTRNPGTSVEPGSGTTVMSYGFTCETDDYFTTSAPQTGPVIQFHAASLEQANAYMANPNPGYGNCYMETMTSNEAPVLTVPGSYTIPKSTPFALTGSATDANNDALTYCWEGMNVGTMTPNAGTLTDLTQPPFFRTYGIPDSSAATRTYPLLSAILNGTNNAKGDKLPSVGIATTHRLTVRDNNAAAGGVSFANVTVTVNGTIGPFLETTNLSGSYAGLSNQTITWSVNGTNTATPNVKISLSTDGGLTFPTVLLASTANDGSESVTLPNVATTMARIKVESVGNIFFDISNVNFTITSVGITCPANSAVCVNAAAFALTGGAPAGGTYSGPGVSAGMFNPATAGAGMHTITYTNGGSCTFVITVNALPVMTCPANSAVCVNAPAFALSGGAPGGGTYSGTGVSSGMFNPTTAGVGMHTITYSSTNGNGCTNTCTFVITVNALPVVTCPANSMVNVTDPPFALAGGTPGGGTYSGPGVSAGMFNPATAGVGMHTITYSSTNGNGCTNTCTFVITVNAAGVTCPANSAVCINAAAFALTGGAPAGGTYSGPGVSAGMFNPATAGAGMHTITYTNGSSCTFVITVNALPVMTCPANSAVCVNAPAFALSGGAPGGGTYSGTGVSAGMFNPAMAGVGMHTITYSSTNGNGCTNTCTFVITVNALPVPVITGPVSVCSGGSVTLDAGPGYSSYSWSNGGGSGQTATFSNILVGTTYSVTVTNANGCSGSATKGIEIQSAGLPSGWSNGDVGGANGSGTANSCTGEGAEFVLTAVGFSTSSSDKLHAVYQQLCGNSEIIAHVSAVSGGGWGGIMIRETLMPGAKKVAIKTQLSNILRREIRTTTNGAAAILNYVRPGHDWLRLVRAGSSFVGYSSTDGINWNFAFTATISMTGCVYVGLFSESINGTTTNTATFDNVSVSGTPNHTLANGSGAHFNSESGDQVQVYPNPTTGEININLDLNAGKPGMIQVYNAFGELVTQEQLVAGDLETRRLRIAGSAGVYTLVIQLDDQRIVRRVVVNPNSGN